MPLSCERLESVFKSRAEGFSRFFWVWRYEPLPLLALLFLLKGIYLYI